MMYADGSAQRETSRPRGIDEVPLDGSLDLLNLDLAHVVQVLDEKLTARKLFQNANPKAAIKPTRVDALVCLVVALAYRLFNARQRIRWSGQPRRGGFFSFDGDGGEFDLLG